jgi:hypothetical protein
MSIMYPYPAAFNVRDPWYNPGTGYTGMVPVVNTGVTPRNNALVLLEINIETAPETSQSHSMMRRVK